MSCHPQEKTWRLYVSGDLSGRKRRRFEEHLAGCPECQVRNLPLERSAALAAESLAAPAELSAEEWQRIQPVWDDVRSRGPRMRWALATALAAAVLVVVLAALLFFSPHGRAPATSGAGALMVAGAEDLASLDHYEVRLSTSDPDVKIVWTFDLNFEL